MEATTSSKFERLLDGEDVVTNYDEMDVLERLADAEGLEIRTQMNPQRIGVLDQYVAWIGDVS